MSDGSSGLGPVCGASGRWAGGGFVAAIVLLLAGCAAEEPSVSAGRLDSELANTTEAWAAALERLRPYDNLDLDRRFDLAGQRTAALDAELDKANAVLALAQERSHDLLAEVEGSTRPLTLDGPTTKPDWAAQLQAARQQAIEAERKSVQAERKLTEARGELAGLRRLIAQRDILVRQADEQEVRLRLIEKLRDRDRPSTRPAMMSQSDRH